MSTELKTKMQDKTVVRFWGGDERGVMLQVTGDDGYVQFELKEAVEIVKIFSDYITTEAKRRQSLLEKKVRAMRLLESTVFKEVASLDKELYVLDVKLTAVQLIDKYTPIYEEKI